MNETRVQTAGVNSDFARRINPVNFAAMLTIRPTKMLARRLQIDGVPEVVPVVTNRVADWCVHEFKFSRWRYLMFCNTASLYPVVTEARGVTDDDTLIKRMTAALRGNLEGGPYAFLHERWIAPHALNVQFAPIPDRSVLGGMNELIFAAKIGLEDGMTPSELSSWLAETPLSKLGMNSPERVFPTLKGGAG